MSKQVSQSGVAPPADSGLRCPKCDYNLTGVTGNRCPECGEAFDPEWLQAVLEDRPVPIPIWDDKQRSVVIRFTHLCLLTWFLPWRLSRRFPRRYSHASARRFRWLAVLIAVLVWMVRLAVRMDADALFGFLIGAGGYLAGVLACESMLSGAFWAFLWPEKGPSLLANRKSTELLNGLVGMFRTFVILESLAMAIGTLVRAQYPRLNMWPVSLTFAVALWWWVALAGAIAAQPGSGGGKVFSLVFVVPVVVLMSLVVACVAGAIFAGIVVGIAGLFT